jgi:hypothetical protein
VRLAGTSIRSNVELAWRNGEDRSIVTAFRALAREILTRQPHPAGRQASTKLGV